MKWSRSISLRGTHLAVLAVVTFGCPTIGQAQPKVVEAQPTGHFVPLGVTAKCLAFSPDGTTIAVGGGNHVRLFASGTGKEMTSWTHDGKDTSDVAFDPKGERVAAVSDAGTLWVWQVKGEKESLKVKGLGRSAWGFRFTDDGRHLQVIGAEAIGFFDATSGDKIDWKEAGRLKPAFPTARARGDSFTGGSCQHAKFPRAKSPEETFRTYAVGGDGKSAVVAMYEAYQKRRFRRFDSNSGSELVEFDDTFNDLMLFDGATGKQLHSWPVSSIPLGEARLSNFALSPKGDLLAIASTLGQVAILNVKSGETVHRLDGKASGGVHTMAFSADGKQFAASFEDVKRSTLVWRLGGVGQVLEGHSDSIRGLAVSADGKRLAAVGFKELSVWEIASGERVSVKENADSARFVHGDQFLLTAYGSKFKTRRLPDLKLVDEFTAPEDMPRMAEADADGKLSAVAAKSLVGLTAADWDKSGRHFSGSERLGLLLKAGGVVRVEVEQTERQRTSWLRMQPFSMDDKSKLLLKSEYFDHHISVSPGGDLYAVYTDDAVKFTVFDSKTHQALQVVETGTDSSDQSDKRCCELVFSRDGKTVFYSCPGRVIEYRLATKVRKTLWDETSPNRTPASAMVELPGGQLAASFWNEKGYVVQVLPR